MFLEGASRVGITPQHLEILQGVKQLLTTRFDRSLADLISHFTAKRDFFPEN